MLKRKDLAKQFELVVQQEIKNHNAAVNQSNQSINEIRNSLEELSKKIKAESSLFNSYLVNQGIQLSKEIREQNNQYDQVLSQQRSLKKEFKLQIDELIERLICLENYSLENSMKQMQKIFESEALEKINQQNQEYKSDQFQLKKFKENIEKHLKKWSQEINIISHDIYSELKGVYRRLDEMQKDIKGTQEVYKKLDRRVMVTEKKLENIYVLLDEHGIKNKGRE